MMPLTPEAAIAEVEARRWAVRPVEGGWVVETGARARVWPRGHAVEADFLMAVEKAIARAVEVESRLAEREASALLLQLERTEGMETIEVEEKDEFDRDVMIRKWRVKGRRRAHESARAALRAMRGLDSG